MAELPFTLTEDEQAEVARVLAELHEHGYQDVERHVHRSGAELAPGTRIRHAGHQWYEALREGTGHVVAITERPDSAWSRSWGMPDVELIAVFDKPWPLDSRLSQLAQYHVRLVASGSKASEADRA